MRSKKFKPETTKRTAESLIREADEMTHGPHYRRNYSGAFQLYKEAELFGSDVATDRIGRCYWAGLGVDQNLHQAAIHFLKAARMGNPNAMYNLGRVMNGEGKGSIMGQQRAIYWFEEAARNGVASACWNLGYAYLKGEGVQIDYEKAMEWFTNGGNLGNSGCYTQLGLMYYQGLGVESNHKEAVTYFQKAAQENNSDAYLYLGYCYEQGTGVRKSLKDADKHYENADMYGNVNALEEIFAFEKRHPLFKLYKRALTILKFFRHHIKYTYGLC